MCPSHEQTFQIAIDGPSGVGKSSTAEALAKKLNYTRIDSGTLYRALTYIILQKENEITDKYIYDNKQYISNIFFEVISDKITHEKINIKPYLRHRDVDLYVSVVARHAFIREKIKRMQHNLARNQRGIIIDGRDIGTIILPNANLKIFLTASEEIRAKRRWEENGKIDDYEKILTDMKRRDYEDINREHGPLKKAEDAIIVDNSNLSFEEQVDIIYNYVLERKK